MDNILREIYVSPDTAAHRSPEQRFRLWTRLMHMRMRELFGVQPHVVPVVLRSTSKNVLWQRAAKTCVRLGGKTKIHCMQTYMEKRE